MRKKRVIQQALTSGKIIVPGGVQYRLLALPDHKVLSLKALEKVNELLQQGATILGPKPTRLVSLVGGAEAQKRFKRLADELWGSGDTETGQKQVGNGRLIWGKTAREVLTADGLKPDCEIKATMDSVYDYIHYNIEGLDVYFVCNQSERTEDVLCSFRIAGKTPQLWDPLTGQVQQNVDFLCSDVQTTIPLRFDPYGSMFVVFINETPKTTRAKVANYMDYKALMTITGLWQVAFDPQWGGPEEVIFDRLVSWTERPEPGVKFYSGKATYSKTFTFDGKIQVGSEYMLDLGEVGDIGIAHITLNGKDLGVVWTKPFRVDITDSLKEGANQLQVNVVNSWRNRLVGDRGKGQSDRYTKTNIAIGEDWKLLACGLLGPVTISSGAE